VGQVKFFARKRVGGQVVLGEAIRLYKCAVS
jgi:predicted phage gp36 major capsid-like protein